MSVATPFLKRGVTLANFQSRGTAPCDSEALIMRVRGLAITSESLSASVEKRYQVHWPSLAFSCLMVLRTNVSLTFPNLKLGCDRLISCRVCCLFVEFTIPTEFASCV